MTIYKSFTFDSAHRLTKVPADHKCATMHGHTYILIVFVTGEPGSAGMIIDYADLARAVEPIVRQVDHKTLNEIHGLENPTTEVLAPWLGRQISAALPECRIHIELKESSTTGCTWNPEEENEHRATAPIRP